MVKINQINNFNDIAQYLGISTGYLQKILFQQKSSLYTSFNIPKKNGELRLIHKPSKSLMVIQIKIKELLESSFNPHSKAHGFIKDKDFITNASNHVNRKYVLNFDLEDFFNSISFSRVRQMFIAYFRLNSSVATVLANLCCHPDGFLPQGSPTSPVISNVIIKTLDKELTNYVKKLYKTYYTRYVDDITISSNSNDFPNDIASYNSDGILTLSDNIQRIIIKNGFRVKESKTRLQSSRNNQTVTGITVNKKINLNRRYIKNIRAILHKFDITHNLEAEIEVFNHKNLSSGRTYNSIISVFLVLKGKIMHIAHVRGYNDAVFQKLSKHFNQIVVSKNIKIKPIVEDNSTRWIEDNIFVIDPSEETRYLVDNNSFDETFYSQGTAFYLKGVGLVTNYHVIKDLVIDVIEKKYSFCKEYYIEYKSYSSIGTKRAKIVYYDKNADIAILEPESLCELENGFKANTYIRANHKIKLAGYPEYYKGDHLRIEEGIILRQVSFFGNVRYDISPLIFGGNSGGPILNKKNEVVGVAVRGITQSGIVPPQIIPIEIVLNMLKENEVKDEALV